jgi:hypothetical protein
MSVAWWGLGWEEVDKTESPDGEEVDCKLHEVLRRFQASRMRWLSISTPTMREGA